MADTYSLSNAPQRPALGAQPSHNLGSLLPREVAPEQVGCEDEGDPVVIVRKADHLLRIVGDPHAFGP